MTLNTNSLSLDEVLRYAELGQIKGIHPDAARMLADKRQDEEQNIKAIHAAHAEELDEMLRKLQDEVRPSVLDELRRRYAA
jgi:hypothetical protein